MRFLIVDDSDSSRKHLRQVIAEMGHEVIGEGHDGEQAVALYASLRPDVVVMDVIMPKLTGSRRCRPFGPTIPRHAS